MNKPTIICVDDETMILKSLKTQLKNHLGSAFYIETVESAEEALELMEELFYDKEEVPVVISDQIMPGMKGDEFLIEVKKRFGHPIKKIMLTGQASAESVGNAINHAGLYRFIAKPWNIQDLNMTITEALNSFKQQKELEELESAREKLMAQLQNINESLEVKVQERTKELELKNSLITSSIKYAKLIQDAIMQEEDELKNIVPNSFVINMPKDIVSGDFYWCSKFSDTKFHLVVSDCTGHGVAGAFMSLIGMYMLNKLVSETEWTYPNAVFNSLKEEIINTLHQTDSEDARGMDASMISVDKEQRLIHFSGAYNKLYLVRKKEHGQLIIDGEALEPIVTSNHRDVFVIDGDRQSLAKNLREEEDFTLVTIEYEDGDHLYLSSDGYFDQFGGENSSKFLRKRFANAIAEFDDLEPEKKKEILLKQILDWKGDHPQTDDICLVGLEL